MLLYTLKKQRETGEMVYIVKMRDLAGGALPRTAAAARSGSP